VSELQENLDQALRTIIPGEPPVDEAMRRGKTIRIRRWVAAAGAVAVVVGAVIGYPALAHLQALPAPITKKHVVVTVNPPGPHSPSGLIASGMIGTQPWQLIIENPDTSNQLCFNPTGSAVGQGNMVCEAPAAAGQLDGTTPITFQGTSGQGQAQVLWGPVLPEVSYATAKLADGTVLTLHPVKAYGARYVGFAVPSGVGVTSVTAYSRRGEISTAIPFNYPGGLTNVVAWLRPGQSGQARFTARIASGTTDGHAWRATAYVGPWGTCVEFNGNDGYCYPDASARGTSLVAGGTGFYLGSAAPSVSYVTVDLKGGSTMRVAVTAVGPQKFFAFGLDKGQSAKRWTAYDAAGKPVASGVFKF
jgi:hypothetical protein